MVIVFATVRATAAEGAEARLGDDIVAVPDVVMDRAFTVPGGPASVWPWLVQLGKHRAGWYLPRRVERFLPRGRRAIRVLDPRWATLHVGDIIPDYGGRDETFTVAEIDPARHLVYWSRRGRAKVSCRSCCGRRPVALGSGSGCGWPLSNTSGSLERRADSSTRSPSPGWPRVFASGSRTPAAGVSPDGLGKPIRVNRCHRVGAGQDRRPIAAHRCTALTHCSTGGR